MKCIFISIDCDTNSDCSSVEPYCNYQHICGGECFNYAVFSVGSDN